MTKIYLAFKSVCLMFFTPFTSTSKTQSLPDFWIISTAILLKIKRKKNFNLHGFRNIWINVIFKGDKQLKDYTVITIDNWHHVISHPVYSDHALREKFFCRNRQIYCCSFHYLVPYLLPENCACSKKDPSLIIFSKSSIATKK